MSKKIKLLVSVSVLLSLAKAVAGERFRFKTTSTFFKIIPDIINH